MLNSEIANRFIKKLSSCTHYNINLMDENGIILASCDPTRIGTFHEIAFNIIKNHQEIIEVVEEDHFLGVYPGVNMLLVDHNNKGIGVVGITGNPNEVRPVALITKMAVETLLENERQKEKLYQRHNMKDRFLSQMLYEDLPREDLLMEEAEKLGYQTNILRIPILIIFKKETDSNAFLNQIKGHTEHTAQDMSLITRENHVLIYKTLPEIKKGFSEYKEIVHAYIDSCITEEKKDTCYYLVGTIQNKISQYRYAFKHCQWLIHSLKKDSKIIFFYDHLDDYMKSLVPDLELHRIFNCYRDCLDDKFKGNLMEIADALKIGNYNLHESSEKIFIHKNTLVFRLNKIKHQLNINPLHTTEDRDFIEYLSHYFHRYEK